MLTKKEEGSISLCNSNLNSSPLAEQNKLKQEAHQNLNNLLQTQLVWMHQRQSTVCSVSKYCSTCLHFGVSLCTAGPASSSSSGTPAVYLQRERVIYQKWRSMESQRFL